MKKFIPILFLLPVLLGGNYPADAQTPDFVWAERAGGSFISPSIEDRGFRITIDSADDLLVVGKFMDVADFDGTILTAVGNDQFGPRDIFIAKYTSDGNLIWIRHAGGSPNQAASNGSWGVAVDNNDNVVASGFYTGSITFDTITLPIGGALESVFLVKYDPGGNLIWAKAGTGPFQCHGRGITTDNNDNILATGNFAHQNFGGSITFGTTTLNTFGGTDIYIAKFDASGNLLWARHAGSSNTGSLGGEVGVDIVSDNSGNSIIVGWFIGTANLRGP